MARLPHLLLVAALAFLLGRGAPVYALALIVIAAEYGLIGEPRCR